MPETVDKATDIYSHAEDSQEQSEHVPLLRDNELEYHYSDPC